MNSNLQQRMLITVSNRWKLLQIQTDIGYVKISFEAISIQQKQILYCTVTRGLLPSIPMNINLNLMICQALQNIYYRNIDAKYASFDCH